MSSNVAERPRCMRCEFEASFLLVKGSGWVSTIGRSANEVQGLCPRCVMTRNLVKCPVCNKNYNPKYGCWNCAHERMKEEAKEWLLSQGFTEVDKETFVKVPLSDEMVEDKKREIESLNREIEELQKKIKKLENQLQEGGSTYRVDVTGYNNGHKVAIECGTVTNSKLEDLKRAFNQVWWADSHNRDGSNIKIEER